jgi:hypothetical protein
MALAAPPKLLEAIAASAGAGFITNPIPETPTGTNAASIEGGFPPKTMQNELAGGLPPLGQDMNGFLFLVSSHTLWVESGQLYLYDADISTAIGGYPVGTQLGMSDGSGIWLNTVPNNTTDPESAGVGWVPRVSYGFVTVPVVGGTVNLNSGQSRKGVIVLSGALVSNLAVNLPPTIQEWLIINGTSGTFTTTVKTAASGSQGVNVPQGGFASPVGVYSIGDGNIYPTVAPLGIPIDQNPTPLTIVERTNAGYVLATYFNSNAPADNLTVAQVITTNGDGFLRKNALTNFESQMLLQGIGGQVSNGQVPFSAVAQWAAALFSSPQFTGVPIAPTAALGTSNTQVATTAFANPGVTINGNGICINLPNGFKLQAGSCNPAGGAAAVTFPVAFTSRVDAVIAISVAGGSVQTWLPGAPSLAGVTVRNSGGSAYWFAIGA